MRRSVLGTTAHNRSSVAAFVEFANIHRFPKTTTVSPHQRGLCHLRVCTQGTKKTDSAPFLSSLYRGPCCRNRGLFFSSRSSSSSSSSSSFFVPSPTPLLRLQRVVRCYSDSKSTATFPPSSPSLALPSVWPAAAGYSQALSREQSLLPLGGTRQMATRNGSIETRREYQKLADQNIALLSKNCNQALALGQFAIDFIRGELKQAEIGSSVLETLKLFHTDSVLCGLSALALRTNAPSVLREEALTYPIAQSNIDGKGACVFGDLKKCAPEKAVVANCSAVREWDSNGTVFGFNPHIKEHQAGEFGHNDFYPVVIAACQARPNLTGVDAVRGMLCLDEIRGRLCEVFSLKTYKIDHVVHGAIASAAVYGALMGATAEQIESAIGMTVAHYIPFRAIRAGRHLSDSKGASAALSAEAAVLAVKRSMMGFVGPKDIFRNPEAIFCWFEKHKEGMSPFDIRLTYAGDDFAVCGMHFKLGLYEHQSAGALEGLIKLLSTHPQVYKDSSSIQQIVIKSYEPAFGIIGDPAKRDPKTRQSADHSMVYIISTMLRKAIERKGVPQNLDEAWCALMLTPYDYNRDALVNTHTRKLMELVKFEHGGPEYDKRYPDGIPTSLDIHLTTGNVISSGLIMYPTGHARNTTAKLRDILNQKFKLLGEIAAEPSDVEKLIRRLTDLEKCSSEDLSSLYHVPSLKQHLVDGQGFRDDA